MTVSATEVAAACAMLREERPLERHYIAAMLEAQQAEIKRLREVLQSIDDDYVSGGVDGGCQTARAALAAPVKYPRITEGPAAPVPNQGWGKRRKPKAGA